ncbi:MAG: hypothetical protein ACREVE_03080 [Gammaproteobacteria bacterium]
MGISLSQDELLDIYKVVMEEYRYQVSYNWDRLRFCLTLSLGLTSIAFAMLYAGNDALLALAALFGFSVGGSIAWLGIRALKVGMKNYRKIRKTKKLMEKVLKLHHLQYENNTVSFAMAPTEDLQARASPKPYYHRFFRKRSINQHFVQILRLLVAVSAIGALTSAYRLSF